MVALSKCLNWWNPLQKMSMHDIHNWIFQGFQAGEATKRPSIFQCAKKILKMEASVKCRSRDQSPQPLRASTVMFVSWTVQKHRMSPRALAEFILETNYPSRRKIRQTDNSLSVNPKTNFDEYSVYIYLRVTPVAQRVFWCWAEEAYIYFDLNCSIVNSLTSTFLAWNSFFYGFWISSNIFTFADFFSAKRCSTVAYPTVWSLPLYCGSNITSAKTSVSRSFQINFVFPFFFEEAVALLDAILK